MAIFNSYFDITRGYPPRSSQAAFAESHPTTGEKLCDELRDGWLFCYHQHLPGLKIDPKMWSKWDGIENLTHLTRLEPTWNGSWCFYGKPSYREGVWQDKHGKKHDPRVVSFNGNFFGVKVATCSNPQNILKYPSQGSLFFFIGPQHQKSSISWHQTLSVENMAPLADGPSDCRFAATSGASKAFDRPPRKAMGSVFDGIWMVYGWYMDGIWMGLWDGYGNYELDETWWRSISEVHPCHFFRLWCNAVMLCLLHLWRYGWTRFLHDFRDVNGFPSIFTCQSGLEWLGRQHRWWPINAYHVASGTTHLPLVFFNLEF